MVSRHINKPFMTLISKSQLNVPELATPSNNNKLFVMLTWNNIISRIGKVLSKHFQSPLMVAEGEMSPLGETVQPFLFEISWEVANKG